MAGTIFYRYSSRQVEEYLKAQDSIILRTEEYDIASVRELISAAKTVPGKKKIVYFAKAEKLSEATQNTLLISMEDDDDVEYVFTSSKKLIPTVESRSQINEKAQITKDEFTAIAELLGAVKGDAEWLYIFCDADTDVLKAVISDTKLCSTIRSFTATPLENKKELLSIFSLLREKDKNSFFATYKEWMLPLLQLILYSLTKKAGKGEEVRKPLEKVGEHLRLIESPSYSVNDLLDLLIGL